MRPIGPTVAVAALLALALAAPLRAQTREDRGRHASFTAGASFGDGQTAPALSAGMRFILSDRLGVEFEAAHARKLDFTLDLCPAPLTCVRGGQLPVTGRTVSLIPHLVVEIVPESPRIRVYAQAGVGAGHVRQRYFDSRAADGADERVEHTRSSLTVAISFGGGATVRILRRFAVGADVRLLHLLDEAATLGRFITPAGTLSTLRIGSRLGYEF
jgi:hypothetical protein